MKKAWGERDPAQPADTVLEVPSVGERPSRVVSYAMLSGGSGAARRGAVGINPGGNWPSGCEKQLGAGVVLTGGGSKVGGLATLAEQTMGLAVRARLAPSA